MSLAPSTPLQHNLGGINQAFKEREIQRLAKEQGLPYVYLIGFPINPDLASTLTQEHAIKAGVAIFFKSGKKIKLASSQPDSAAAREILAVLRDQGYEIALHLCSEESLKSAYRIYTLAPEVPLDSDESLMPRDLGSALEEIQNLTNLKQKIENAPYEAALNYIMVGAYRTGASDIHFQPEKKATIVRFRIDGVLQHVFDLTSKVYYGILTEIKYTARLKANVIALPQDGQFSCSVQGQEINVRVSTLPTQFKEACVMRLLDSNKTFADFATLGYTGKALKDLEEAMNFSHGMILITGPTGSGKTTTLYSMLKKIDVNVKKVLTLEDPIEYDLPGISQSQVDADQGFDFLGGLRAVLRQDPDVIMVGEIRDLETAETAAQAALTGHLVVSTLHTNSAVEAIPRLVNMGVRSFILAPALKLLVAQRLVRKVCPHCSLNQPLVASETSLLQAVLQSLQSKGVSLSLPAHIKHVVGCTQCSNTGYMGQISIAETLPFDSRLRDFILENKSMPEIYRYIDQEVKMVTLKEDGMMKVMAGITTLEEVLRVAA